MDDEAGLTERWDSLPGSKRWAGTPEERADVLSRHNVVLSDLYGVGEAADEALVAIAITCAWGDRGDRAREPDLVAADPAASFWRSDQWDPEPDHPATWTHLWTSTRPWSPGSMDELLTLVADGKTADVVAPLSRAWLYHPYDGGADVIAASTVERDRLAATHESWLAPDPHTL